MYIDAKVTLFAKQNKKKLFKLLSLPRFGRWSCLTPYSCDQGMTAQSNYVFKGAETQVGASALSTLMTEAARKITLARLGLYATLSVSSWKSTPCQTLFMAFWCHQIALFG